MIYTPVRTTQTLSSVMVELDSQRLLEKLKQDMEQTHSDLIIIHNLVQKLLPETPIPPSIEILHQN